ncbi:MAG: CHASE2 domain-containing protein [Stenomitos frigidus ULC029]
MHWRFSRAAWRLLPGGLTTLVFAALLSLGALQPLEQLAYSILFQLRGERAWDDRLVLIAIDDASIKQIGRFPWSRQQYVKLLEILSAEAAAPSVVVIDLIWSESSPDDAKLAQAIDRSGRVVLTQARDSNGLLLLPVATLQNAAIATGHIFSRTDADGLTRVINLFDKNLPTLGLAAVQAYTLVQASVPLPTTPQPLWVNWAGRAQTLQQYSFSDVIQGRVPAQAFQRKIVFVGLTAAGIDPLSTPFDRNPPATGVYLSAAVANNLLQQNALQPVSFIWSLLILCLAGPGLSLLLSDRRESNQMLILLGLSFSWGAASLWLFHLGYWVPVVLPLGLCSLTTLAISFNDRLRLANRLQLQVQQLWQRHRADLVTRLPDAIEGKDAHPYQKAGLLQSVTRITALAEQFARSQSTQAAIARNLSIGLLAADFDGVIWFCNPAATDWLQAEVGSQLSKYLVPNWVSEDQWQADLQRLKHPTAAKVREVRECQQGDRWFELQLEPLVYQLQSTSSDRADGFLVVLEDITPRKQVEATLYQQVAELQRVGQLKDDFLSTVSHELRSPLTNIKMAIEMLKISRSKDATDRYLQILQNECARETDLINDLLDLQRLEAGAQTYTPG